MLLVPGDGVLKGEELLELSTGRVRLAPAPSVAVVHDYLTQRGGAERVVLSMLGAFPAASLHTSVYDPDGTYPQFREHAVSATALDRIRLLRSHHRLGIPLYARAFDRLQVDADVVVCSSSGWAHGVRTDGRKVVYCYAPARWLHQPDRYLRDSSVLTRASLAALAPRLRTWDAAAASSADRYLTSSTAVRDQIRSIYGIDAEVVPPPHGMDASLPVEELDGLEPGYHLCVARLLPYKNVDAVIAAFEGLPAERLVVVGDGPLRSRLEAAAGRNVSLVGTVSDAQLRGLYAGCKALVAASHEDFGLTPLEAAAFGRPSAVLRWGGFLDTVVEGETGAFFDEPTPAAIRRAVQALEAEPPEPAVLEAHAARYDERSFQHRLRQVVAEEAAVSATAAVDRRDGAPDSPVPDRAAPRQAWSRRYALDLVFYDVVAASVAAALAYTARFGFDARSVHVWATAVPYGLFSVVMVAVWLVVMALSGTYSSSVIGAGAEEYQRVVNGGVRFVAALAFVSFAADIPVARAFVGVLVPLALTLTVAGRWHARRWLHRQRARGACSRRVVVTGSPESVLELTRHLHRSAHDGYRVVGVCLDGAEGLVVEGTHIPVVARPADLLAAVRSCRADVVAVAGDLPDEGPGMRELGWQLEGTGVQLVVAPPVTEVAGPRLTTRQVAGVPLLHVEEPELRGVRRALKTTVDRVAGIGLLVLASPVLAVLALLVRLTSSGPVLFRQERVGRGGTTFRMLKFRTMVEGAEGELEELRHLNELDGPLFKMRDDPRRTPVGRFLRRWSLDELPQLWHVARGEMSLVGPRPPLPSEVASYEAIVSRRLLVRPGLTGLWQVSGRAELPWAEAVRLDVYYVENWSLALDAVILGKTAAAVLRGRGAY